MPDNNSNSDKKQRKKKTRKQNIHNNNDNNKSLLKHWVVWVQQIKWIQENQKKKPWKITTMPLMIIFIWKISDAQSI